jgi:hypothetical protein
MKCNSYYVSADLLYWSSHNDDFRCGTEELPSITEGLVTTAPDEDIYVSPDWDFGFRVGLGWNTNYDFWDIFLNYTWFKNTGDLQKTSSTGFFDLGGANVYGNVSAKYRLLLNMGDLEVGRTTYLGFVAQFPWSSLLPSSRLI